MDYDGSRRVGLFTLGFRAVEYFELFGTAPANDFRIELAHGWYDPQDGIDAPCLVRPGPYIPSITMPSGWELVVTDQMRAEMVGAKFDITFREVYKYHIPELHWEQWDMAQDVPESEWPDEEIEPWLLKLPHSVSASRGLGTLWEIVLPFGASVEGTAKQRPRKYKVRVDASTWAGMHLCAVGRPPGSMNSAKWPIVSTIGRKWIETHAGDWFQFRPCIVTS